ncbi:MAG: YegP family protein [Stackebrandtia sp.]
MAGEAKFELFPGDDGKVYFRLKAVNGEVIAASQAYESRNSAVTGIEAVKADASKAPIVDVAHH